MYFRNQSDCIKQLRLETTKDSKIKKTDKKKWRQPILSSGQKEYIAFTKYKNKTYKTS